MFSWLESGAGSCQNDWLRGKEIETAPARPNWSHEIKKGRGRFGDLQRLGYNGLVRPARFAFQKLETARRFAVRFEIHEKAFWGCVAHVQALSYMRAMYATKIFTNKDSVLM